MNIRIPSIQKMGIDKYLANQSVTDNKINTAITNLCFSHTCTCSELQKQAAQGKDPEQDFADDERLLWALVRRQQIS